MSKLINKWVEDNEKEHGHYACFAGFESEIKGLDNNLSDIYEDMEITDQIALFSFICDLLKRENDLINDDMPDTLGEDQ